MIHTYQEYLKALARVEELQDLTDTRIAEELEVLSDEISDYEQRNFRFEKDFKND